MTPCEVTGCDRPAVLHCGALFVCAPCWYRRHEIPPAEFARTVEKVVIEHGPDVRLVRVFPAGAPPVLQLTCEVEEV